MPATFLIAVFWLCLASSVSCEAQCPVQMDADVLILGAGMAGLGAAEAFSKMGIQNFLIIDQRDKIGGRVQSEKFGGGIVELGPQWLVRDDADPTDTRHPLDEYVARCNITIRDAPFFSRGAAYYNRNRSVLSEFVQQSAKFQAAQAPDIVQRVLDALPEDEDLSMSQGLRIGGWNPCTQMEEFVEVISFDAFANFPASRASYRNFQDPDLRLIREFTFADTPAIRSVINPPDGYYAIPKCIADGFLVENDQRLILNTAIMEIEWGDNCICAISGDEKRFCAPYAIITFSIGELQNDFVTFAPPLPFTKTVTFNQQELGHFLKIYVSFNDTFWDVNVDAIAYYNEFKHRDYYPVIVPWGAEFPEPTHVLEFIINGLDESKRIVYQDIEITRQEIYEVLRDIYGDRASEPVDILMNNFISNPFFYGNVFHPHIGFGQRQIDEMNAPCGNLYFSGEYLSFDRRGGTHGAMLHGRDVAARIAEVLIGPLQSKFCIVLIALSVSP